MTTEYIDGNGNRVSVGFGPNGGWICECNGKQLKNPALPKRKTKEECETDLDAFAIKHGWAAVKNSEPILPEDQPGHDIFDRSNYELTTDERTRFDDLCGIVDRGIKTFFEVGMALAEIRDSRLYRETHETFEDFCRDRWDIGRSHSYRYIEAAYVVKNLSPIGDKISCDTLNTLPEWGVSIPMNEAQARPLTMFEADIQRELWKRVIDCSLENNGRITATLVSSVVADYLRKSHQQKMNDTKERVSRETLIEPKFKQTFQTFIDVVSDTINTGFKGTSREAVLRHIDAVRELVANTK